MKLERGGFGEIAKKGTNDGQVLVWCSLEE